MNSRTGRVERVYVDLEAVYPNPNNTFEEYSFEELIVKQRGWLNINWEPEPPSEKQESSDSIAQPVGNGNESKTQEMSEYRPEELNLDESSYQASDNFSQSTVNTQENTQELKPGRARRMKVREIKAEAQTSRTWTPWMFLD